MPSDLPVAVPDQHLDALEHIRTRIERLTSRTLEECERVMAVGTPAAKLTVAKSVLPQLIRVLGEQQEADTHAEMREALAEMREALRETVAKPAVIVDVGDDEPDLPEDAS